MTVRHFRRTVGDRRYPLINAADAVRYFLRNHGVRVSAVAIRQWASRGKIGSHSSGRDRYDLREIVAYAQSIGLIQPNKAKAGQPR